MRFYSAGHVQSLQVQIARLEQQLAEERQERRELLDRLLAKNNVEPVRAQPLPDPVQIIHPFGTGATPEVIEAMKESFLGEEIAFLQAEHGMTEEQAKAAADREWLARYKAQ